MLGDSLTIAPERIHSLLGSSSSGGRVLYTDGSYDQGVAGWAVVEDGSILLQDWSRGLTSNLAEGYAVLEAVKILGSRSYGTIVTDSMVWADCVNRRRTMKGKAHKVILEELYDRIHDGISIRWIAGHSGEYGNELADMYAKQARLDRISRGVKNW